jgi:spore maturation protein CgeB
MDNLRILAVADLWQGSNAYAFVRALRRLGHSVRTVPSENFVPGKWRARPLRGLRRLLEPALVSEYTAELLREAELLRPHLFFVYKGHYVTAEAVRGVKDRGAVVVDVYPDVSVLAHGRWIPRALPEYDWVFTTKKFGLGDMERLLGVRRASFLPHGFDPEVHRPLPLSAEDRAAYACDVSFVGTWSPKKQSWLEQLARHLAAHAPGTRLRVWGEQWTPARHTLGDRLESRPVLGLEYSKAIQASRINLGLLSEARQGASSGDQITSRTFHIPACGGFLLHERTAELTEHFREGEECAAFEGPEEMAAQVVRFLGQEGERSRIAAAGRSRVEREASIDHRAAVVLAKVAELRGGPPPLAPSPASAGEGGRTADPTPRGTGS